jgi:hypothetical protein
MKTLTGRSMFVWRLSPVVKAELGAAAMANKAKAAGLTSVWIKVADGKSEFENVRGAKRAEFLSVRDALREQGIDVWGWHVPYGASVANARAEADLCVRLASDLKLDGLLMDAEGGDGFFSGGVDVAVAYAEQLSKMLRDMGVGLAMCGNDIPTNFPNYPFDSFVASANTNAPQVYYGSSPSVQHRLGRAITANRHVKAPFYPVGAAWIGEGGGCQSASACAERAREFLRLVKEGSFPGCGFWHWMGAPAAFWEVLIDERG